MSVRQKQQRRLTVSLPRAATGQAMIEYMIVTAAVGLVLFVPSTLTDNLSVADYAARAVRTFFRAYSFLVSVS